MLGIPRKKRLEKIAATFSILFLRLPCSAGDPKLDRRPKPVLPLLCGAAGPRRSGAPRGPAAAAAPPPASGGGVGQGAPPTVREKFDGKQMAGNNARDQRMSQGERGI